MSAVANDAISICPKCQNEVSIEYISCPSCGADLLGLSGKLISGVAGVLAGASAGVLLYRMIGPVAAILGEGALVPVLFALASLAVGTFAGFLVAYLVVRRIGWLRAGVVTVLPMSALAWFLVRTIPEAGDILAKLVLTLAALTVIIGGGGAIMAFVAKVRQ